MVLLVQYGRCVRYRLLVLGHSTITSSPPRRALPPTYLKACLMKSRLSLIFTALVVLLGSMVWVVRDRNSASTGAPAMAVSDHPSISNVPITVATVTETPAIPIAAVNR